MTDLTIKFSHSYVKLPPKWEGQQALLIGVTYCPSIQESLPGSFLEYDTMYYGVSGVRYYDLSKLKAVIVLVFACEGVVFTTIRRWTPEKYGYYRDNLFKWFTMVKSEVRV